MEEEKDVKVLVVMLQELLEVKDIWELRQENTTVHLMH
jgi:hypothetical protein